MTRESLSVPAWASTDGTEAGNTSFWQTESMELTYLTSTVFRGNLTSSKEVYFLRRRRRGSLSPTHRL